MSEQPPNLPGVVSGITQQNFDALNGRLGATELGSSVTELPGSAQIGESCLFEAAAGVYWHLVYTGEETYPWAKIGGAPLRAEIAAQESTTSTAFTDLTTLGPSIAAPLLGEYYARFGALLWGDGESYMDVSINGDAPGETYYARNNADVPDTLGSSKKVVIPQGQTARLKYKTSTGSVNAQWRWLEIDPGRVG